MAPNTRGRVVVQFDVAPSGKVTGSRIVSSDIQLKKLDACMQRKAMHLKFPAFEGEPMEVTIHLKMGADCPSK